MSAGNGGKKNNPVICPWVMAGIKYNPGDIDMYVCNKLVLLFYMLLYCDC